MDKHKILLITILATAFITGCNSNFKLHNFSKSDDHISEKNLENLDPGITNQAPKISCDLTNTNSPSQIRRVDTISERDTFFNDYPTAEDIISFDCSKSSDENSATIRFEIDTDYEPNNPQWQPLASTITLEAGRKNMAIKAEDEDGLTTIKTFSIEAKCKDGIKPSINTTRVHISTDSSKHNFYHYSANGAVTGGDDIQYAWDFNGDGVFDRFPMINGSIWVDSATVRNVYSIFASAGSHKHQAFLKARNACNLISDTVAITMPDEKANIERTSAAQAITKSYYYLQADIQKKGIVPPSLPLKVKQRTEGPFLATQYPNDSPKRVRCTYLFKKLSSKGHFTIEGSNWYQGGNQFIHGMKIHIANIPDNGQSATQTYSSSSQSNNMGLNSAFYKVSGRDDSFLTEKYDRLDQTCSVEISIERGQPVSPCSKYTNWIQFEPVTATRLYGEFNCDSLTNTSTNAQVKAKNGKFYCEVAARRQCIRGGSNNGGTPPTPQ